jgi:soluble lytic murein transglycosylase-like protein
MNYSAIALALGYATTALAPLTPVPTHVPLRTITTVFASVPSPSPSLQPLPPGQVRALARAGARDSGLDESLVESVILSESGGDPNAVSRAGAVGMMQLMPETAHNCGIRSRWVAADNVRCGSQTLALLVRTYRNIAVALAAYNAGAAAIASRGAAHASRWPTETQRYVRVVVEKYDALQH